VKVAARELVNGVRAQARTLPLLDALLQEYSLDNAEGVLLMSLAEALLRIPDKDTADAFIRDKLLAADWLRHRGHSHSPWVNASTWGLGTAARLLVHEDE